MPPHIWKIATFLLFFLLYTLFPGYTFVEGTLVSGDIHDDITWNEYTGDENHNPYIVEKTIVIHPNATLTIGPGVIVKFQVGTSLIVHGTLTAAGEYDSEILFTSNETSPAAGDWGGIQFPFISEDSVNSRDSEISNTIIEFSQTAIECDHASPKLNDNIIGYNELCGVELKNSNTYLKKNDIFGNGLHGVYLKDCSSINIRMNVIFDNEGYALYVESSNPRINGNTFNASEGEEQLVCDSSANAQGNLFCDSASRPSFPVPNTFCTESYYLAEVGPYSAEKLAEHRISLVGSTVDPLRIKIPEGLIASTNDVKLFPFSTHNSNNFTYFISGDLVIEEDAKLTLEPGTVIKSAKDSNLIVRGTLVAEGTEEEKIFFTSYEDEPERKDYWGSIQITSTSLDSTLIYCDISYGGRERSAVCVDSPYSASPPVIMSNTIANNGGYNIEVPIEMSFSILEDNTFFQNAYNALCISGGMTNSVVEWNLREFNDEDFFYVIRGDTEIGELRVYADVVVALEGSSIIAKGQVKAMGELGHPVVFTSYRRVRDEEAPAAGDWGGLILENSSEANTLKYCNIEYGTDALSCISGHTIMANVNLSNNRYSAIKGTGGAEIVLAGANICANDLGLYLKDSSVFIVHSIFRNNGREWPSAELSHYGAIYGDSSNFEIINTVVAVNEFGIGIENNVGNDFRVSYSNIWGNMNGNYSDIVAAKITEPQSANISEEPLLGFGECEHVFTSASPHYGGGKEGFHLGCQNRPQILNLSIDSDTLSYDRALPVNLTMNVSYENEEVPADIKYSAYILLPSKEIAQVVLLPENPGEFKGAFQIENNWGKGRYILIGTAQSGSFFGIDTLSFSVESEGELPDDSFQDDDDNTDSSDEESVDRSDTDTSEEIDIVEENNEKDNTEDDVPEHNNKVPDISTCGFAALSAFIILTFYFKEIQQT